MKDTQSPPASPHSEKETRLEPQNTLTPSQLSPGWQNKIKRAVDTISAPLSSLATAFNLPPFAPVSFDQELTKATSILTSFTSPPERPPSRQETIPPSSLASAAGLAILTSGRLGLRHVSGSTGSGILIARHPDTKEWCAPVAVRSFGAGAGPFAFGFEVAQRVYILPDRESLVRLAHANYLVGGEAGFAVGGLGRGGGVAFCGAALGKDKAKVPCEQCGFQQTEGRGETVENGPRGIRESLKHPIQCYMRSKGLYAGFQAEGLALEERAAENVEFYGKSVSALQSPMLVAEGVPDLELGKLAAVTALLDVLKKAEEKAD